jgi:glycerol-3-phosphate dehydrogenase
MTPPGRPPALTRLSRSEALARLRSERFDVLILGGGINGAGLARDLALRAQAAGAAPKIALVEQRHFASGTSGKNSQLIHGGLRYLKQFEFHLVREALGERATLLEIAPHLVEPLPFLIPFYGPLARLYYGAGLALYDFLAGERNISRRRILPRAEVERLEPGLSRRRLTSAGIYYDCRVNAARLVLENLFDAARLGVAVANYVRAEGVARRDGDFFVVLADRLSGERFEACARQVVDATGPWQPASELRLVRGSHLVLPKVNTSSYAIAHFAFDGRIFFVIPWGPDESLSLVGTTDVDHHAGPDEVRISAEEVRYMERVLAELFPQALPVRPVSAYSSLRPLLRAAEASATETSREHRIWTAPNGVLRIAGGKYTTYRKMSEEAAEALAGEIAPAWKRLCRTSELPLGGNSRRAWEDLRACAGELAALHGLERTEVERLIHSHGLLAPAVVEHLPEAAPEGLSRLEAAVASFAVEHEMVERLADLLFVSTYWGYERPWQRHELRRLAGWMGTRLGWDEARQEAEVNLVEQLLELPGREA